VSESASSGRRRQVACNQTASGPTPRSRFHQAQLIVGRCFGGLRPDGDLDQKWVRGLSVAESKRFNAAVQRQHELLERGEVASNVRRARERLARNCKRGRTPMDPSWEIPDTTPPAPVSPPRTTMGLPSALLRPTGRYIARTAHFEKAEPETGPGSLGSTHAESECTSGGIQRIARAEPAPQAAQSLPPEGAPSTRRSGDEKGVNFLSPSGPTSEAAPVAQSGALFGRGLGTTILGPGLLSGGPPEGGPEALGNNGSCASTTPAEPGEIRRKQARYRLLDSIRKLQTEQGQKCCKVRVKPSVQIQETPEGRVVLSGVSHCHSVHSCPHCAPAIFAKRAEELEKAVNHFGRESCRMLTLTIRHAEGYNCRRLVRGLASAWRKFMSGRRKERVQCCLGMLHYVRSLEVTHGPNGWHPHYHVLIVTRGCWQDAERFLAGVWQECVDITMGPAYRPTLKHGLKLTELPKNYLLKMGVEASGIMLKEAREDGHRTSWRIANDAGDGDKHSRQLWHEYVRAIKGARQLTWSRELRKVARIRRRSDSECVEETGRLLYDIEGQLFDSLCKQRELPLLIGFALARDSRGLQLLLQKHERAPPIRGSAATANNAQKSRNDQRDVENASNGRGAS
jgi:hypothetical protein